MAKVKITETVLRDAHQSLIATRMPSSEMEPILDTMDQIGYNAVEQAVFAAEGKTVTATVAIAGSWWDASNVDEMIKTRGVDRGYHMNKQHWVTINVNDTDLTEQEILGMLAESDSLTK